MKTNKRGLGRGINELIQDKSQAQALLRPKSIAEELVNLPISEITANPYQPRSTFNEEALGELAASISEFGVLQPLIVTKKGKKYELIAGERRLRAAKIAGLENVPVILRKIDDKQQAQIALIENVQREDLNPIEEARAYTSVIENYGITQEELGQVIGKSRGYIGNTMRLLRLDPRVVDFVEAGKLSISHGKQLLSLPTDKQYEAAVKIIDGNLTVRKTDKIMPRPKKSQESIYFEALENELMGIIGSKVRIVPGKNKGHLEIDYYGNEDLERIITFFKEQI
ncbi:MAG: ParB/RepB/Spo0J family partition protein [Tissierellia bacterium]|nr:ParB/RepB/Spo0J family partition protein [Tissierellia bacterium]